MFDVKSFKNSDFTARVEDVPVPGLAQFFAKGTDPVFKVRNLTGVEIGQIDSTGSKYRQVDVAAKALHGTEKEKIEAFKKLFGMSDKMTEQTARDTAALARGSVAPKCDLELAAFVRDRYPAVFSRLVRKIYELSELGACPGEPKGSTACPTLEPA